MRQIGRVSREFFAANKHYSSCLQQTACLAGSEFQLLLHASPHVLLHGTKSDLLEFQLHFLFLAACNLLHDAKSEYGQFHLFPAQHRLFAALSPSLHSNAVLGRLAPDLL